MLAAEAVARAAAGQDSAGTSCKFAAVAAAAAVMSPRLPANDKSAPAIFLRKDTITTATCCEQASAHLYATTLTAAVLLTAGLTGTALTPGALATTTRRET